MKKLLGLVLAGTFAVGSASAWGILPSYWAKNSMFQKDIETAQRSFVAGLAVGLLSFEMKDVHYKGCIVANTADQLTYDRANGFFTTGKDAQGLQPEVKLGMARVVLARVIGTAAGNKCGLELRRYAPVAWAYAKKYIKKFSDKYCVDEQDKLKQAVDSAAKAAA